MAQTLQRRDQAGQIRFYYIFVTIFLALLFACAWVIHIKRRRRLARPGRFGDQQTSSTGPNPQYNLHPWPGYQYFARAPYATTGGRGEEGLNEWGEAPPPYKPAGLQDEPPRQQPFQTQQTVGGSNGMSGASNTGRGIAIPLQALSRDPPQYEEQSQQRV